MIEIIAGVIVLILAIIGIAKLVQGRGGGGGGGKFTRENLLYAVKWSKEQISDVYNLRIDEAVNESGKAGASAKRAYDGIRQIDEDEMEKLQMNKLARERYLQLFRMQRIADTTAKYIKTGVQARNLSERDASSFAKEILGAFGQGEKALYNLKKKAVTGG